MPFNVMFDSSPGFSDLSLDHSLMPVVFLHVESQAGTSVTHTSTQNFSWHRAPTSINKNTAYRANIKEQLRPRLIRGGRSVEREQPLKREPLLVIFWVKISWSNQGISRYFPRNIVSLWENIVIHIMIFRWQGLRVALKKWGWTSLFVKLSWLPLRSLILTLFVRWF